MTAIEAVAATEALPPTRAVAERVSAEGITLADLRRALPPDCLVPDDPRSWLTFLRVVALAVACVAVLARIPLEPGWGLVWQVPALVGMWFLYGTVLVGFFLVGHDAQHRAFSRRPWVNRLMGYVCLAPLFNGPLTWKLTHDHHHTWTQLQGQDVDWAANLVTRERFAELTWREHFAIKLGYAIPFGIFFWIGRNTFRRGFSVRAQVGEETYRAHRRALIASNAVMLAASLSVYAAFWWATGFWGMWKLHGIPLGFAGFIGAVLVAIGHASEHAVLYERAAWTPARGQLASTYNYRMPRWFEWLVLDINIHIPHHISPRIPWYKLERAGAALRAAYPSAYREVRLTWAAMAWVRWAPFLSHDPAAGLFEVTATAAAPLGGRAPSPAG